MVSVRSRCCGDVDGRSLMAFNVITLITQILSYTFTLHGSPYVGGRNSAGRRTVCLGLISLQGRLVSSPQPAEYPRVLLRLRCGAFRTVAYPGMFFGLGVQQIQLRTEVRENGDLGAVAP